MCLYLKTTDFPCVDVPLQGKGEANVVEKNVHGEHDEEVKGAREAC